jgi:hypothetical protein
VLRLLLIFIVVFESAPKSAVDDVRNGGMFGFHYRVNQSIDVVVGHENGEVEVEVENGGGGSEYSKAGFRYEYLPRECVFPECVDGLVEIPVTICSFFEFEVEVVRACLVDRYVY